MTGVAPVLVVIELLAPRHELGFLGGGRRHHGLGDRREFRAFLLERGPVGLLQLHPMERAHKGHQGPELFLRQRVFERGHGRHGEFVITDLVADLRRCVLHIARDGRKDLLVLQGAHLVLVGQVLGLGIGHELPVEALAGPAVLAVAVGAVIGIEPAPLGDVLVLEQSAPAQPDQHRHRRDRDRPHAMLPAHADCPFLTLRMMTYSTPAATTTAMSP